ncbi:hypothetical protein K7432_017819, partial [Basidiobolus ranarum]
GGNRTYSSNTYHFFLSPSCHPWYLMACAVQPSDQLEDEGHYSQANSTSLSVFANCKVFRSSLAQILKSPVKPISIDSIAEG